MCDAAAPRKTKRAGPVPGARVVDVIAEMAARAGGVSARELSDAILVPLSNASAHLAMSTPRLGLHKVRPPGQRCRWFADRAGALAFERDALEARQRAVEASCDAARRAGETRRAARSAEQFAAREQREAMRALDAKLRAAPGAARAAARAADGKVPPGAAAVSAEVVVPPHVRVVRVPGFVGDPRFAVPDGAVGAGFAAAGIGRYVEPAHGLAARAIERRGGSM